MANTLKDYLVGIDFNVNEGAAARAENLIRSLDQLMQRLGQQMSQASGQMNQATGATAKHGQAASQASGSVRQLTQATRESGRSAVSAMQQFRQLENGIRKVTRVFRRFAAVAATLALGGSLKSAINSAIDLTDNLAEKSKELGKSAEDTRAYQLALAAMGKTAKEIEQSETLKTTFEQLQAIGKEMALPEAAQGLTTIRDLKQSLMELKVTGNYALQWMIYKVQELAAGPLYRVRETLTSFRETLANKMPSIAEKFAHAFGNVVHVLTSVVKVIGNVIEFINELPPGIKLVGATFATVWGMIRSKTFLVSMIIGAILLLLDDLQTYLEGGESLFGGFWGFCIEWGGKALSKIQEITTEIKTAWEKTDKFTEFIKALALGDEYDADSSWAQVGEAIWDKITEKIGTAGDLIAHLVLGDDYNADDSWYDVGQKIWNKITKNIGKAKDIVAELIYGKSNAGEGGESEESEDLSSWEGLGTKIWKSIQTGIEAGQSLIQGILDGIVHSVSSVNMDGSKISLVLTNATTFASKLATTLLEGAITGVTSIGTFVTNLVDAIASWDGWNRAGEFMGDLVTNLVDAIASVLSSITDDAGKMIGTVGNAALNLAEALITSLTSAFSHINLSSFGTSIAELVTKIAKALADTLTPENIQKLGTDVVGLAKAIIESLASGLSGVSPDDFGKAAGSIVETLANVLTGVIGTGVEVAGMLAEAGINLAEALIASLGSAFDHMNLDTIGTALTNILNRIGTLLRRLFSSSNIEKFGVNVLGLAKSILRAIGSAFTNLDLSTFGESLGKIAKGIFDGIKNIFSRDNLKDFGIDVIALAKKIMTSIASGITGLRNSLKDTTFSDMLKSILDGIFGSISDLANSDEVQGFITSLSTALIDGLGTVGDILGTFMGTLMSYLFTEDGLLQIYDAGKSIASLLYKGIKAGISGAGSMMTGIYEGILKSFGIDVHQEDTVSQNEFNTVGQFQDAIRGLPGYDEYQTDPVKESQRIRQLYAMWLTGEKVSPEFQKKFETLRGWMSNWGTEEDLLPSDMAMVNLKKLFGIQGGESIEEQNEYANEMYQWAGFLDTLTENGALSKNFFGALNGLDSLTDEQRKTILSKVIPASAIPKDDLIEAGKETAQEVIEEVDKGAQEAISDFELETGVKVHVTAEEVDTSEVGEDVKEEFDKVKAVNNPKEVQLQGGVTLNTDLSVAQGTQIGAAFIAAVQKAITDGNIAGTVSAAFASVRDTVSSAMAAAANAVIHHVSRIKASLSGIPSALGELGLTGSSYGLAIGALGGNANANVSPGFVAGNTTISNVTHNTKNVSAPATINVYGKDAMKVGEEVLSGLGEVIRNNS